MAETLTYVGFFILIGFVCFVTNSAWPLLALLLLGGNGKSDDKPK